MAQVTITETATPSRSKGRGWAYIDQPGDNLFASPAGRTLDAEPGDLLVVHLAVELRRASRATKERESITVRVTGDNNDTVTASIGSPQSYDITVTGCVEA